MKINFLKYWKEVSIIIGFIFMIMYFFSPKTEEIKVPIRVEVPVPVIKKEFDTIYEPKPYPVYKKGKIVKEIDSAYYEMYMALNDSLKKDSMLKKAITINAYKEKIEDDTITINLNMKVRGDLLSYQVGYKTKPYSIPLDTTLNVKIPTKSILFIGGGVGVPLTQNPLFVTPLVKGGLYLKTKGDNLINIEFDTQGRGWIGYAWKI